MYARLKDNFLLRGWNGLPYAVLARKTGDFYFLTKETFSIFEYLDGYHNVDPQSLSLIQQAALAKLQERNAIAVSAEPFTPGLPPPLAAYKEYPCRAVTKMQVTLTGGCNLKCRHCYISAPHYKYNDVGTAEWLGFVDQIADAGVVSVSLTGGEPLIRKDFWTIVDAFIAKGISVDSILTNGLLVDDAFLDEFQKRRLSSYIAVSFDGVGGAHDWLRGLPGCEEKTVDALRRIIARHIPLGVSTTLHTGNIDALIPTYEFMLELGVPYWRVGSMTEIGEWQTTLAGPDTPQTLPLEVFWSRLYDLARRYIADGCPIDAQLGAFRSAKKKPGVKRAAPPPEATENVLNTYSCGVCRFGPTIMPDGRLMPCTGMTGQDIEIEMPNLQETSLVDVYSNMKRPFFKLANLKVKDVIAANESCRNCEWRFECKGGCRLHSMLEGRGVLGYAEDTCEFYKSGWWKKFRDLSIMAANQT